MENLIKIRESDWHFRLIKYCWGIDPKMFRNLCPYFWLTIASLFVVIPIGFYKIFIKKPIISLLTYLEELEIKNYEKWIKTLDPRDLSYLYASEHYDCTRVSHFEKKLSRLISKDRYKVLSDIKRLRPEVNLRDYDFIAEFRETYAAERKEKRRREDKKYASEVKLRRKMDRVIKISKFFATFLLICGLWFIGYFLTNVFILPLVYVLSAETDKSFLLALGGALLIGGVAVGLYFLLRYLYNLLPNKIFKVIFFPFYLLLWILDLVFVKFIYRIIIRMILGGICEGIGEGFSEFGGIFKDYMKSSYSDYCPGIEWKDEEK